MNSYLIHVLSYKPLHVNTFVSPHKDEEVNYKTLADYAGVKTPDYVDGGSLRPVVENPNETFEKPVYCTWGNGNISVRKDDWRYIRYFDKKEEENKLPMIMIDSVLSRSSSSMSLRSTASTTTTQRGNNNHNNNNNTNNNNNDIRVRP